ncbi:hypothetical protein MM236_11545 [Belliella sp. DSM 107340]|uniref:Uncharacterized protein n=1 Tax=Belliella calami TaxID=2923436 RepID=A0ABS9UPT9_9BACT|nr:hypothetical protein [Belliella calami]MCH7398630.1 hypothetical protein [Belliella calami]
MKILIANSYSLDIIYKEWSEGKSPSHFLFGKIELEKHHKIKVDIVPFEKWKFINKLGKIFKFGNLDQELWMLFRVHNYDLIYATFGTGNTKLLSFFKLLGFIKTPIVMLGHQNLYIPEDDRFGIKKKILLSYERILFFSKELMVKTIKDLDLTDFAATKRFDVVNWAPDREYYGEDFREKLASESKFAICAGTTDRDFDLIIDVFKEIGFPLEIYCTPGTRPRKDNLPSFITINSDFIPYSELVARYKKARFILIPIKDEKVKTGRTLGLTVLLDSIAIGKPVIMTKNKYVDLLDPQKKEFGLSISNNTKDEWVSTIKEVLNDFYKLDEMGRKGHELFLNGYNSVSYSNELMRHFTTLITDRNKI